MSTFYAIKREDEGNNGCPYWHGQSTWGGSLLDAKRFACPYEAEVERKRAKTDNKNSWIVAVQIVEQKVQLEAKPIPTRREPFTA